LDRLANRVAKHRLIDESGNHLQFLKEIDFIIPRPVPQLECLLVVMKVLHQCAEAISACIRTVEAGRKLKENATELAGFSNRGDSLPELVHIARKPEFLCMGELLPCFHRELEALGSSIDPILSGLRRARTIESGVDFDRVEIPRVET